MNARKTKHGTLLTVIFSVISLAYVFPIVLVLINSFKKKAYISKNPFSIPTGKMFVGIENGFLLIYAFFLKEFIDRKSVV